MAFTDWLPVAMAAGGYLLGSVPFGIIVAKSLGTVDPRTAGSRNIGFTNVLRVSGVTAGLLTLAGDAGKGWLAGWVASHSLDQEAWVLLVAFCAIVGHVHSVFLGFRGGKGVATALGAVTGVDAVIGGVMLLLWVGTAAVWRYSSAAALAAFAGLPLCAVLLGRSGMFQVFSLAVAAMILLRHTDNIRRLWQGIEPRLGR